MTEPMHGPAEPPANKIEILQTGSRLQITADVDEAGLQTLQKILPYYQLVLKVASPLDCDTEER